MPKCRAGHLDPCGRIRTREPLPRLRTLSTHRPDPVARVETAPIARTTATPEPSVGLFSAYTYEPVRNHGSSLHSPSSGPACFAACDCPEPRTRYPRPRNKSAFTTRSSQHDGP